MLSEEVLVGCKIDSKCPVRILTTLFRTQTGPGTRASCQPAKRESPVNMVLKRKHTPEEMTWKLAMVASLLLPLLYALKNLGLELGADHEVARFSLLPWRAQHPLLVTSSTLQNHGNAHLCPTIGARSHPCLP